MAIQKYGPPLAFAVVLTGALGLWPVGCAHNSKGPMGPGAESAEGVRGNNVPVSFLPAPAFAYAATKNGPHTVSLADVAEEALPSVVNVSSTKVEHVDMSNNPFLNDPFFQHFFGGGNVPRERREYGLGSGVIINKKGVILTNNHVVAGASTIKVTTHDRREFKAKVIGTDPKSDVAVIQLEGKDIKGLKPIEMGDSSRLRLGDVVLAIGNPFGVGQTVTMGIVSAKGRANVGIADYEDFIQTDAAINPGNSGGALVDMEGKLIGINTAILSRSGGYQGIGFAIPTNMAKPIMESLIKTGKVVRGWLGVSIQNVDQDLAQALKLPSTEGVLISDVGPNSPAANGGLKRGDVILKLNGSKVDSTGVLRNLVAAAGAHVKVHLDILRAGKPMSLDLMLGEMPASLSGPPGSQPGNGSNAASSKLGGLTLENLSTNARQRFNIPDSIKQGVVVAGVSPGSTAAEDGLRPGDVVLQVNKQRVSNIAGFRQLYSKSKGRVLLLVSRRGHTLYLVVDR